MPNREPDLGQLLRRALDNRLQATHTCAVGVVKSYKASKHVADVQLTAKRPIVNADDELVFEDLPILPDVPVISLGTSRSHVRTPLQAGDAVLIVFAESSIAEFLAGQDVTEPGDTTDKGLSNGFAIPFVRPSPADGHKIARADLVNDNFDKFTQMFQGWTPVPQDGGAALKAAFAATVKEHIVDVDAEEILVK